MIHIHIDHEIDKNSPLWKRLEFGAIMPRVMSGAMSEAPLERLGAAWRMGPCAWCAEAEDPQIESPLNVYPPVYRSSLMVHFRSNPDSVRLIADRAVV